MPVPGADSTREAASPCLGRADAKEMLLELCKRGGVVCCLPHPFYYLLQQIIPLAPGSGGEPGVRGCSGLGPAAPVFLGFAAVSCTSAFIIESAGGISSERLFRAVSDSFADSNR